jgi:hypothetical protein
MTRAEASSTCVRSTHLGVWGTPGDRASLLIQLDAAIDVPGQKAQPVVHDPARPYTIQPISRALPCEPEKLVSCWCRMSKDSCG